MRPLAPAAVHLAVLATLAWALFAGSPRSWAADEEPGPPPAETPGEAPEEEAAEDARERTEDDEDDSQQPDKEALLEVIADLRGHSGPLVRALAFSPDGKVLATSGSDRSIRLWHVGSAKAKAVARVPPSD